MAQPIILLADNAEEYLETCAEFLERGGFRVEVAPGFAEAKNILERGGVDLAVLDLRLVNNNDKKDFSGLELAAQVAPSLPKIILTEFESFEAAREALGARLNGLSPAVGFLSKAEGNQALLTTIRRALAKVDTRFRQGSDNLALKIEGDYIDARQQAKWHYRFSLLVAIAGITIILVGLIVALWTSSTVSIPAAVAGVITEAVSVLFFRRADAANARMDRYHHELLEIRWLENLLAACEELSTPERQEGRKEKTIQAATESWFRRETSGTQHALKQAKELDKKEG